MSERERVGERWGLVYHAGGLGDFVLSLPAILRVGEAFPAVRWCYWGPRERLALLPGYGPEPPELGRFGHTLWGPAPESKALERLRGCVAALVFGGRELPGWTQLLGSRALPLASFPEERIRVPAYQARQLDRLGIPRLRGPCLPDWRGAVLPHPCPQEILLHPGSGDPKKNLVADTWLEALALLRARAALPVRLVLGPAEEERGGWSALAAACDGTARCPDLRAFLERLSLARLFLGNDSGASHLAAVIGIPTLVAFAPSDPFVWRPLGPRVRIVAASRVCAPCTRGRPISCDAPECLGAVPSADLARGAAELLSLRPLLAVPALVSPPGPGQKAVDG